MRNHWSVQIDELKKDPEQFIVWKLEQRINWGIGERKIKKLELVKYWSQIDIDPFKRKALSLALS
ncbi:MAG TPA: hypothetical protein VJJ73_00620 [Candidatus Paceibacterota bacterium]